MLLVKVYLREAAASRNLHIPGDLRTFFGNPRRRWARSWQALYRDKTGEVAVETNSGTSIRIIVPFPSRLEMSIRKSPP